MANNLIQLTGTATLTVQGGSNGSTTINNNAVVNLTGSTMNQAIQTITSGSVQSLQTSSCPNIRYIILDNIGTASIGVYSDAAATKQISYLWPGDNAEIPWSGSTGLYAQSLGGPGSSSLLEYWVAPL